MATNPEPGVNTMSTPIRIFIVEDQPKILKSQIKVLSSHPEVTVVGSAMSGVQALKELEQLQPRPDVVLMDLGLPDISGIEVTQKLRAMGPKPDVLIFTVFDEEDKVLDAIRAGAAGYLVKGAPVEKVIEAIRDVHGGGSVIQPGLARSLLRHFQTGMAPEEEKSRLTPREIEILQIISKGMSNNEAAGMLGISRATIRTHLEHIYQKLSVSNRVEAITEGIRQGLIDI
ncbi:MAG: Oxygen regulatory protein NreC [Myxococcota bacterium]|nr:Oxygen regulatory protein NreC [Myxococcota bacterium]